MSEQEFQELTDKDYKAMTRDGLFKRAAQIVTMINKANEKNNVGDSINMIIYTSIKNEAEMYARNKRGQEPNYKQVQRLMKTIYKNLVKQKDLKLDLNWIQDVIFDEAPETGVGLMYSRMERVNSLMEKFTKKG